MLIDPSGMMHWGWKIAIGVTVIALLFVATAMTGGAAMALLAATGSSGGYGVAAVILGSALSTATVDSGIGFVSGGFFSKIEGGSFIEGAADGFMWGSITGAVSGVISASFGMINVASRLATGVINFCSTIIASGGVTAIFGLITNTFDWGAVGISTLFGMIGLSVGAKFAAGIGLGIAESISQGTYSFYFDFTLLINNIKRTSNAYF